MKVCVVCTSACYLCRYGFFSQIFFFPAVRRCQPFFGYGIIFSVWHITFINKNFSWLWNYFISWWIITLFEDKYICLRIRPVFEWKAVKKHCLRDWKHFYCVWYNWTGDGLPSSQMWKTFIFKVWLSLSLLRMVPFVWYCVTCLLSSRLVWKSFYTEQVCKGTLPKSSGSA